MAQPFDLSRPAGCSFGSPNGEGLFGRRENYPCNSGVSHPDSLLAHTQMERDTSDPRFAIWGMPVRPTASHFPPNHPQACYPSETPNALWLVQ